MLMIGKLLIGIIGFFAILFGLLGILFFIGCRRLNEKQDIIYLEEAIEKWPVSKKNWRRTEKNFWEIYNRIRLLSDKNQKKEILYGIFLAKYKPYWSSKINDRNDLTAKR